MQTEDELPALAPVFRRKRPINVADLQNDDDQMDQYPFLFSPTESSYGNNVVPAVPNEDTGFGNLVDGDSPIHRTVISENSPLGTAVQEGASGEQGDNMSESSSISDLSFEPISEDSASNTSDDDAEIDEEVLAGETLMTAFDNAAMAGQYDLPLFEIKHIYDSSRRTVYHCPVSILDFCTCIIQVRQMFAIPWLAVDAFLCVLCAVLNIQHALWVHRVPASSDGVRKVVEYAKAELSLCRGNHYAMCPNEQCDAAPRLFDPKYVPKVGQQETRIRNCPKCGSSLFRNKRCTIPFSKIVFFPLKDRLNWKMNDPEFVKMHRGFQESTVRPRIEGVLSGKSSSNFVDWWDGSVAMDLIKQRVVTGQHGEFVLNLCADGVTPGKRSKWSFWMFAHEILSLPSNARHVEDNMLVHCLADGSIKQGHMRQIVQLIVDDFSTFCVQAPLTAYPVRAILGAVSCDHQAVRKVLCLNGANAKYACEQCGLVGCRPNQDTDKTTVYYYPSSQYNEDDNRPDDSHIRLCLLGYTEAQKREESALQNINRIERTGRMYGLTSITEETRKRREASAAAKEEVQKLKSFGLYDFTPFLQLRYFDIIAGKNEDIMHLLCENVAKELLSVLTGTWVPENATDCGYKDAFIDELNEIVCRSVVPSRIQHPPALKNTRWRAIDFQRFFTFYSTAILQRSCQPQFYNVVVLFRIIMLVFTAHDVDSETLAVGHEACRRLYDIWSSMTSKVHLSVHRCCHLRSKTEQLGPLGGLWLYPFERFFGTSASTVIGANGKFSHLLDSVENSTFISMFRDSITVCSDVHALRLGSQPLDMATFVHGLRMSQKRSDKQLHVLLHNADISALQGAIRIHSTRYCKTRLRRLTDNISSSLSTTSNDAISVDKIEYLEMSLSAWRYTSKHMNDGRHCEDCNVSWSTDQGAVMYGRIDDILLIPVSGRLECYAEVKPFAFKSREMAVHHDQVSVDVSSISSQVVPITSVRSQLILIPLSQSSSSTTRYAIEASRRSCVVKNVLQQWLFTSNLSNFGSKFSSDDA
jgi:hypothetical protein